MKDKLIGDELLVLALSSFPADKVLDFKKTIVEGLYQLSQLQRYEHLFAGVDFEVDQGLYSPWLEDAMWSLVASGVISTVSGSPDKYFLTRALGLRFQYIKRSKLSGGDSALVENFSRDLQKLIL